LGVILRGSSGARKNSAVKSLASTWGGSGKNNSFHKENKMNTPTDLQMQKFHRLVDEGRVTDENFQSFLENPNKNDLVYEGCEIIEDVKPSKFQVKNLKFVPFLKEGEDCVKGEVMRERAIGLQANLGLDDLKFVLDDEDEIPAELMDKLLVFAGTILRDCDGNLCVACLSGVVGRWCFHYYLIDDVGWDDNFRLVSCK